MAISCWGVDSGTQGSCPSEYPVCSSKVYYTYCFQGGSGVDSNCPCLEGECWIKGRNQQNYFMKPLNPSQQPKTCWAVIEVPCFIYWDCTNAQGDPECSIDANCSVNGGPLTITENGYAPSMQGC